MHNGLYSSGSSKPPMPQSWLDFMNQFQGQDGFSRFAGGLSDLWRRFGSKFGGAGTPGTPAPGGPAVPPGYNPVIPASALAPIDTRLQANLLSLAGGGDPYMSSKDKKKKD